MTTQREIAERLGLPIHPPKVEVFDLPELTNTDPKGHVRPVATYRREPFGLYLARRMPGHPRLAALESWLLPALGLRVTRWGWLPGHEKDSDFYIDIADVEPGETQWRTVDLYLDIGLLEGQQARLLDTDEFAVAVGAQLLDAETADRALRQTYTAIDGLARHGYRLADWLRTKDIELTWPGQPVDVAAGDQQPLPPRR